MRKMLDERRVLAVKMENDLFVEMKQYLADNHITLQKFVNDLIKRELDSVKLVQETTQKNWDKEEVQKAIDDFIARNGRVPKQTEFKNEN